MSAYIHGTRPIAVSTPLGDDTLLLVGFTGEEGISKLFNFELSVIVEIGTDVPFEKLLGQNVMVRLDRTDDQTRYFSGICISATEGEQDETFRAYKLVIVPQLWFLGKTSRSRIFQNKSVPEILQEIFGSYKLNVSYRIRMADFKPRNFCVQYRESDLDFVSRLMEEEGIFYFFTHSTLGHDLVLANSPQHHPEMPLEETAKYDTQEFVPEERIIHWEKTQHLRSGKYTLWDHNFELPHKHLEAEEKIIDAVQAGTVSHKFGLPVTDQLEIYDYPGDYAKRFDGVDRGGGSDSSNLNNIYSDRSRTTKIRIEQEATPGLVVNAKGNCRQWVSGHKFTLERHFDGNGSYVVTSVKHSARLGIDFRSGKTDGFIYENTFQCIPAGLPFRPSRTSPKPVVRGTQTAVVVGLKGEEIFPDKYGRVKVQFHWDREGSADEQASCWLRVAQNQSGKNWGAMYIPRVGHEVLVDFLEGDPDRPIIVGSVYNESEMPPYALPDEKTKTVIFKSLSSPGGGGFNELRIEDKKGSEQVFIHAERNKDIRIKHDRLETIGNESHLIVKKDLLEQIDSDRHLKIAGAFNQKIGGTLSVTVANDIEEKAGQKYALEAGSEIHLKSGVNLVVESGTSLTLKVGGSFINLNPSGVFISGPQVFINSGGAAGNGAGSHPETPKDPKEADKAEPGAKSAPPPANEPEPPVSYSPAAVVMKQAAASGVPFCEVCERAAQEQNS